MARLGLIIRPGIDSALILAREVISWTEARGHEVVVERETARLLGLNKVGVASEELAKLANPIVSLGGDGTLIGVARYVQVNSPVMIGVNFGNLGFLTEIAPQELIGTLEDFFAGKVTYGERTMITTEVVRGGKVIFASKAVNDTVVQKGSRDKLLGLDLFVDDEAVMRVRADGIIISTPTGSTAYSLAAGGSIVHPSLSAVLVTPICAHSLTIRPLVLPMEAVIEIQVPHYEGEVLVSIDGQVSTTLEPGDRVRVSPAANRVKFVRSPTKSYFEILRTKLNWGIGNKEE